MTPDLGKAQANDVAAAAANGGNANLAGGIMAGGISWLLSSNFSSINCINQRVSKLNKLLLIC